jgi:hypothetical protein
MEAALVLSGVFDVGNWEATAAACCKRPQGRTARPGAGIRVAQGEAVHTRATRGQVYKVTLSAAHGLSLVPRLPAAMVGKMDTPDVEALPRLRDLAGKGDAGVFCVPVKGGFPDEDLLLYPDGRYATHLNHHPGSSGVWRLEDSTLILVTWLGDREWTVHGLRVDARDLTGEVDGAPLIMRRLDVLRE